MKVHFLGIGGSGASGAAAIANAQGFEITGCDKDIDNEFTKAFDKKSLFLNHNPNHLVDIDILAVTPAVFSLDPDNEELKEAHDKGIEVLTWQQFLGKYLTKESFVIAVCGTHGKSTTTAMIANLLEDAGLDPTVELGAIVPKWGTNYRIGGKLTLSERRESNGYFVVEADEFNDNFLSFIPNMAIVTNIEMDHPEYFKDFEAVKESFRKFLVTVKNTIIANVSDKGVGEVLKIVMKQSPVTCFDYSKNEMDLNLKVPGEFNKLNALAVMQVGIALGIDTNIIKSSLENYTGIGRRFEYIGEVNKAKIYSDFGHHPTEIKVTIKAARKKFSGKKLWVIFQPHMFARTKGLFDDFVKVFQNLPAEGIVILDIYPSREKDTGIVSSKQLVEAINRKNVEYVSSWEQFKKEIIKSVNKDDVLFFMGAGDTDKFARQLLVNS